MRARGFILPLAFCAALLTGCAESGTPATSPTTQAPADNGVAALSADEILARATAAAIAAPGVGVKGTVSADGTPISIDGIAKGADSKVTLGLSGVTVDVIKVGADLYLKAPAAVLPLLLPPAVQSQVAAIGTKHVKAPATTPEFKDFSLTLADLLKPEGAVTKGDATTINGQPVITLLDGESKLYIATTGEPYPVRMEAPFGTALDFVNAGTPVEIAAPAADQVFDLSMLLK
jgi:hypothetical protein